MHLMALIPMPMSGDTFNTTGKLQGAMENFQNTFVSNMIPRAMATRQEALSMQNQMKCSCEDRLAPPSSDVWSMIEVLGSEHLFDQ